MDKEIGKLTAQSSIEVILQKALIATAESILQEHGARLDYVNFEWSDMTGKDGRAARVGACGVKTTYTRE